MVYLTMDSPPLPRLPLLVRKIFGGFEDLASPMRHSDSSQIAGARLPLHNAMQSGVLSGNISIPEEFLSFPLI